VTALATRTVVSQISDKIDIGIPESVGSSVPAKSVIAMVFPPRPVDMSLFGL